MSRRSKLALVGNKKEPAIRASDRFGTPGTLLLCLSLALVTLAVFWPVRTHEFVNFDDQVYITANQHVQGGLTQAKIGWAFQNLEAGFWHPLTWLSIMLDCQLYGLDAGGHHFTSVLLHTANALLLFGLCRRMTGAVWPSAVVAGLFALHPLHVEPVAWAADRKDVLCAFFGLLSIWAYAEYVKKRATTTQKSEIRNPKSETSSNPETRKNLSDLRSRFTFHVSLFYALSLLFFACGLMGKTMIVTHPILLLLLDYWPLQRMRDVRLRRLVIEKLPFMAISAVAGMLTIHAERGVGALAATSEYPLPLRAANAAVSYCRYLGQMIWPFDLTVFYPYPSGFSPWVVLGAGGLLGLITLLVLKSRISKPYLAVGWIWYVLSLLPVNGLIQVGAHAHADRYTYIPLIGVFMMLVWAARDLAKRWGGGAALLAAAGLALALCATQARRQIEYWRDSETLFRHAIRVTRNNYLAFNNLGIELAKRGELEEAINLFHESERAKPNYADAHANLGKVLVQQHKSDEGIREYEESLRLRPGEAIVHNNLGVAEAMRGRLNEAIAHFLEAIRLKPEDASAHNNLGMALETRRDLDGAVREYETSLRLKPDDALVESNLGQALAQEGRVEEAVAHFREAIRLNANNPEPHYYLGTVLARQGKPGEALDQFREALRLRPGYGAAQRELQKLAPSGGGQQQPLRAF